MSSTITQLFPVTVAAAPVGATTKESGPAATPGSAPAPGIWDTPLSSSVSLTQGSAMDLTLDAALATEPLVVETVTRVGSNGVFLTVDGWLQVGAFSSPAGTAWSMSASLGGETLEDETTADPSFPAGTWARVHVLVAHDLLMLLVNNVERVRMPVPARFQVPSPLTAVRVENTDSSHALDLAVLSVTDEVSPTLTNAAASAEDAGMGEVRGAFHRVGKRAIGGPTSPELALANGRFQSFEGGLGYWTPRSGGVVVDGPVWERYVQMGTHTGALGLPLTDTQAGTAPYVTRAGTASGWKAGDTSRMSRFEHGVIAWSDETGAHEVLGRVAAHWLVIGGPASPVGLPLGAATESRRGVRHAFQLGDVFERFNSSVAEVHGEILERYDKLDAWDGVLGAPLTDVTAIPGPTGTDTDGRTSLFEHGSIFTSPTAGTHELLEPWASAYAKEGGPTGDLGLPVSGEKAAGANGVTLMEFEHGFLVNHATTGVIRVPEIEVTLVGAVAPSIDDGIEFDVIIPSRDHDAELMTWMSVLVDGAAVPGWDRHRYPGSGHAGKSVSFGNDTVKVAVTSTTTITIVGESQDHDDLSGDDDLGGITRTYGIDTLWGELGPLGPKYDETGTGGDGSVTYKYVVGLPAGPVSAEFREDRWWAFVNGGTDDVTYDDYSQAFDDVEAQTGIWDTLTNPLDHLFYELAIRNIAENGNCHGMSNTALHALCAMNGYRLPLSRWATAKQKVDDPAFPARIREDLNIAHAQQLDAAVIGHLLTSIAAKPFTSVGDELRGIGDIITGGDLALVSFVSISEGKGHSVLAYGYLPRPGFPDSILVADPNVPFAQNADRSVSRIDLDNSGGWSFIDEGNVSADYTSGQGALLFRIPSWVARERAITPMAALGLGVEQLVSSFVVLGGDVGVERLALDGASSLTQVPLVDSSSLTRMYAGQGPVPRTASAILVARNRGDAGIYFRSANVAAGAQLTLEDRSVNQVHVEGFDGIRPTMVADIPGDPSPVHLHLGTTAGRAQRPGWSASVDASIGGSTATFGFTSVGVGVVLDGLADGPSPQVALYRADTKTTSRFLLEDAVPGRRVELRPADMASPFGNQILSGLGKDIAVTVMP
jgi:hypothetical protein